MNTKLWAANKGYYSLRTADASPVVASLGFSEGEKRRPEMRLVFALARGSMEDGHMENMRFASLKKHK